MNGLNYEVAHIEKMGFYITMILEKNCCPELLVVFVSHVGCLLQHAIVNQTTAWLLCIYNILLGSQTIR
jgi:hypothetical protein